MKKTAIMTDSNCGLMPVDGSRLGIYVIPMPVLVGVEPCSAARTERIVPRRLSVRHAVWAAV